MHQSSCFSSNADTGLSIYWYQTPTSTTRRKTLKTNNLFWIIMLIMPPPLLTALLWGDCLSVFFVSQSFDLTASPVSTQGRAQALPTILKLIYSSSDVAFWETLDFCKSDIFKVSLCGRVLSEPLILNWKTLWKRWSSQCGSLQWVCFCLAWVWLTLKAQHGAKNETNWKTGGL